MQLDPWLPADTGVLPSGDGRWGWRPEPSPVDLPDDDYLSRFSTPLTPFPVSSASRIALVAVPDVTWAMQDAGGVLLSGSWWASAEASLRW
jgi:hypothetical protein